MTDGAVVNAEKAMIAVSKTWGRQTATSDVGMTVVEVTVVSRLPSYFALKKSM